MSINKWILSHIWRLIAVSAALAALLTGIDLVTEIIDQNLFSQTTNPWLHRLEQWSINTPCLLVFLVTLRKLHGNLDVLLQPKPCTPVDERPKVIFETIMKIQTFLASAPRLTNLLKNQLDETNRISGDYAISVLTQISCIHHEASRLLSTLTDVRAKAAAMCDHAQVLIESSRQKLDEMGSYTRLREDEIRDDSEAIQQIMSLMKNLLPLTALIGALSKQTRLLAFNASIQAASDRTVDRGFATVADEMRKLAVQIDSASKQVDEVMGQISRLIKEKLMDMISVNRIETEKQWLHTLTDSMMQISGNLEAAVFGLDRLSKDSHVAVQTIFLAVLKAQEMAQFQDISRQQIELVQNGLSLCGERLEDAANSISNDQDDKFRNLVSLDDIFHTLEAKYSMQTQQSIHDRVLHNMHNPSRDKQPIAELF